MKKINPSKFLLILLLCITSFSTKAICICERSFAEDTSMAKAIFIGKVIGIDKDRYWLRGKPKSVFTFQVFESYKGFNKYIGITSVIAPIGDCEDGYFRQDSIYLVMAYSDCKDGEFLWTNNCSNSDLLSKSMHLVKKLGTSIKHTNPYETDNPYDKSHLEAAFLIETLTSKISALALDLENTKASKQKLIYLLFASGAIILILLLYLLKVWNSKKNI